MPDIPAQTLQELRAELLSTVAQIERERDEEVAQVHRRYEGKMAAERERLDKVEQAIRLWAEAAEGRVGPKVTREKLNPDVSSLLKGSEPALQSRLRIGDQRYRILCAVRSGERVAEEEVAGRTGVDVRRIKEQLQDDARRGVIVGENGRYSLTPGGIELLQKFEEHRRKRGVALPGGERSPSAIPQPEQREPSAG